MALNNLVHWYQKKIGTYDKQQWEKTIEQRILDGFTHVPMRTAKLKTELIDVDLVRGSSFPKAKPKHGLSMVARLAVRRLLLLPFHSRWWIQQTSPHIFALFLLLYSLQWFNICLYFGGSSKDADESDNISTSELLIPAAMMLALCTVHSQIVSTNSGPLVANGHKGLGSRRSRRVRCHFGKSRTRRSLRVNNELESSQDVYISEKNGRIEGDVLSSVRFAKDVTIENPPVVERLKPPDIVERTSNQNVAEENSDGNSLFSAKVPPLEMQQGENFRPLALHVHAKLELLNLDDDGFESLNGNVSSDNDRGILRPPLGVNEESETGKVNECSEDHRFWSEEIANQECSFSSRFSAPISPKKKGNYSDSEGDTRNGPEKEQPVAMEANGGRCQQQCDSEEEGECEDATAHHLTEATTSATDWMGVTTNSDECSYSSEIEESDSHSESNANHGEFVEHPFSWEFELSPSILLSPSCASSDRVSCTIWTHRDIKKAELSVLDISSAIIARVETMPEHMDYFYGGLILAIILSMVPSIRRLSDHFGTDNIGNGTSPLILTDLTMITLRTFSDFLCTIIGVAFGTTLWERTVILISAFERLILSCMIFFLLAVAERTFKQRLLYAKLFSHLTSSRRARKSDLPHFRLNKVRNIKTWLSVRSYLKRRGPQRSVDVIVSAVFIITLLLLSFVSLELIKDLDSLHSQYNIEALFWSFALGIFILRFMTLGTKINKKYRNLSVLITEQINLYLQIEQKPHKKEELMVANSVLKLAADLLKELESPFKISGLSANPYLYTITKVVLLSALSGVLSELLGFKLKLHKIKIK